MIASPRLGRSSVAMAMLVTASFFLGGAMATAKVAVADVPPMTVAASRFAIATLLLLAIRQLVPALGLGSVRPRLRDLPVIAGLGLTAAAGYNILLLTGVQLAPASDAAMIGPAVGPVVSTAIAAAFLRERPQAIGLVGLGVSIGGVLLVVSPDGGLDPRRLTGDLFFVGCGVLWGSYLVISRVAARRFRPIDIALYGSLVATLVLLPLALLEGGPGHLAQAGLPSLLAIGHLAALATVTAFVLLNEGLRRLGVSRSASFMMMIPVFGVLQAMVLLGEPLAESAVLGALLVAGGIWLAQGGRLPQLPARSVSLRPAGGSA
jgi:drug/metabolite transporter (DMT)-like permease